MAALRGRAPARGDREGALPQRVPPHPRRAHRGPDPAGGRRPVRACCARWPPTARAWCSSRTRSRKCWGSPTGSPSCAADGTWGPWPWPTRLWDRLVQMMVGHALAADAPEVGLPAVPNAGLPAASAPLPASAPAGGPSGPAPVPVPSGAGSAAGGTAAPAPGLVVRDLRIRGDRGVEAVRGLALDVRPGEIVGIAGVSGNGQRELAEAIAGLRRPTAGRSCCGERSWPGGSPARGRAAGLGYVPEERMRDGVVADFSVAENLLLVDSQSPAFSRLGFLRPGRSAGTRRRWSPRSTSAHRQWTRPCGTCRAATSRS